LVLRHLEPLSAADAKRPARVRARHRVQWWPAAERPPIRCIASTDDGPELAYATAEFGVTMPVQADRLHQVNTPDQPRARSAARLRLLEPQRDERVIDWFCGLATSRCRFATLAREVLDLEGSRSH
jgi:23S rRNA (uracil1939-C5)-methyltransferase